MRRLTGANRGKPAAGLEMAGRCGRSSTGGAWGGRRATLGRLLLAVPAVDLRRQHQRIRPRLPIDVAADPVEVERHE
jgi:hypothetical protein